MSEDILELASPPADARISYGPDSLHFGDLRVPAGDGPHPVIIYVHGGYWRARYDLSHAGHPCAALTVAGFATWNIEYRRIGNPGGGWPGTFEDVARAADYLRQLAARYTLDLDRVVSVGHSAGGHLALWLAGRPHIKEGGLLYHANPLRVRGVVALAAVPDLRFGWQLRLSGGVVRDLLGGTPEDVPERYATASPPDLLPFGIPQVLIHGTEDESVPYEMAVRYVQMAEAAGDVARLITLEGAGHFEVVDPRSDEWGTVVHAVRQLFDSNSDL